MATRFLLTLKEFPPSQTPGSFNLDAAVKRVQEAGRTERGTGPARPTGNPAQAVSASVAA